MSIYKNLFIDGLSELADRGYQERVWAGSSSSEMSSFDECVERVFDDSGLTFALGRGKVFGSEVDGLLRVLSSLVDAVDAAQPVDRLLRDPVLVQCRSLAARILEAIQHRADEGGDG